MSLFKKYSSIYWLLPLVLALLQLLINSRSQNQIRFEEMVESTQAVFWLDHRLVISGLHTNIGWYDMLLITYKLFGYSIHMAETVRLYLYLGSLYCLAIVLKKYFSFKNAALLLLTIGLSPTLIFYNSQSLQSGIDFEFIPFYLIIVTAINFKHRWRSLILGSLLFILLMFGALVYPSLAFYVPIFGLWYLYLAYQHFGFFGDKAVWLHLIVPGLLFLLPLIINFIYITNNNILVYDADNTSGLFRGGGKVELSDQVFTAGFGGLVRDLFVRAGSYHFEASQVEFNLVFPIISLVFVIIATWQIFRRVKQARILIGLGLFLIISDLIIVSITSDYGIAGMRRGIPTLAVIYGFLILSWYYLIEKARVKLASGYITMACLSLLLIHHVIVYPINLVHQSDLSPFLLGDWFPETQPPQVTLDGYLSTLKTKDLQLDCRPFWQVTGTCSYELIYTAIANACEFNHQACHRVYAFSRTSQSFVPITTDNLDSVNPYYW